MRSDGSSTRVESLPWQVSHFLWTLPHERYRAVRAFPCKDREKVLLGALAGYDFEGEGEAWPAVESLARDLGWLARKVRRALRDLEDLGVILSIPRWQSVDPDEAFSFDGEPVYYEEDGEDRKQVASLRVIDIQSVVSSALSKPKAQRRVLKVLEKMEPSLAPVFKDWCAARQRRLFPRPSEAVGHDSPLFS